MKTPGMVRSRLSPFRLKIRVSADPDLGDDRVEAESVSGNPTWSGLSNAIEMVPALAATAAGAVNQRLDVCPTAEGQGDAREGAGDADVELSDRED
jgi:hypothetical protein